MLNLGRKIFHYKKLPVPTKTVKQMIKAHSPVSPNRSSEVWFCRKMMAKTIKGMCYKTLFYFIANDKHLQPCLTFVIEARGLSYKTFYSRNLLILLISQKSGCPWQAFPE